MKQQDRLIYLIDYLLNERDEERNESKRVSSYTNDTLRSLLNIRPAKSISDEFIRIQDEYLKEELNKKKITYLEDIEKIDDNIYLWQGDITTLGVEGIVNAANEYLEGCFIPCHNCIDNVIHSASGIQLRLECSNIIKEQGHLEKTGNAKITSAYNLPSKFILHTVGPIITSTVTKEDEDQLSSCYRSCLNLATKNNLSSIAFCCISTGEFHYPNEEAAKVAINTVKDYLKNDNNIKVIFNVFKDEDYKIYKRLLS